MKAINSERKLLSEGAGCEHLSDKIECSVSNIYPRSVESDDGVMVECAEKVNLGVNPLQVIRRLKQVDEPDLIPCYFYAKQFIERLVNSFHCPLPQNFIKLPSNSNSTTVK